MKNFSINTLIFICFFSVFFYLAPGDAKALSGSEFNASNIISDTVFFNNNSMTDHQIQQFLNSKVPVCDTWHAPGGGFSPPFTCLKDFVQPVPSLAGDTFCSTINGNNTTYSAAQIIKIVSDACGINPQVLLVLLQKEQSLITDVWPWPVQYLKATGYGCPDTSLPVNVDSNQNGCYDEYEGFFKQVYTAARQFNRYIEQPNLYNYAVGRNSFVGYQVGSTPNSGCGGTYLTPQTQATAALYNYTPYQPNAAALANLYGTGDSCSAYGNRNFWRLFNDWFGSPHGDLVRTLNNGTVYLISDNTKFPIHDVRILNDYLVFGPIRIVSDTYINSKSTGSVLRRMVQAPDGTLYYVNASIKLPFSSCSGDVIDYGYSCSIGQYAQLNSALISRLSSGPRMTKLIKGNNDGTIYFVENGKKRPILGWGDLISLGIPLRWNVFTAESVNQIPTGANLHGAGVLVRTLENATVYMVKDSLNLYPLTTFVFPSEMGLSTKVRFISDQDRQQYTVSSNTIRDRLQCGAVKYILTNGIAYSVNAEEQTLYDLSDGSFLDGGYICGAIKKADRSIGRYLRTPNGTIYYINDLKQKQAFGSINSYINHQSLNGADGFSNVSQIFSQNFSTGSNL